MEDVGGNETCVFIFFWELGKVMFGDGTTTHGVSVWFS